MKWFKNAKIQYKLLSAFGILLSITVILAAFGITTTRKIEESFSKLAEGPTKRSMYILEAVAELTNIRRCILSMGYAVDDEATLALYHEQYKESAERVLYCLDAYYENLSHDEFFADGISDEKSKKILEIRNRFVTEYLPYVEGIYRASYQNNSEMVYDLVVTTGIPLGNEIRDDLKGLYSVAQEFTDKVTEEAHNYSDRAMNIIIAFAFVIITLFLTISVLMANSLKEPIEKMEFAVKEISKGNLAYPIRSGYSDELGMLANHIGNMVDTISVMNKTVKIVDMLDQIIFVTDLDYNLLYANKYASDVYGFDKDACIGKKCYSVFSKSDDCACGICPLPNMLPNKEDFPVCLWETYEKKTETWMSCQTSIIQWVDGSFAQMVLEKDNTLQKQHEKQQEQYQEELRKAADAAEEASRLKSSFLANMSHEIRTPMNVIVGFSELALNDELPAKTRDYLYKIKSSSDGLLQIINDILDLSKIEAGKLMMERIPFDLQEVFKICRAIIEPKATEKSVALFCYVEPSLNRLLVGDPTRLRQVLLNLLSNAVKFTNYGIVKLLSSVKAKTDDTITIHFEVKDSGIGISREQIASIFEPFMQADESTTRKYGGTGLGLSITKSMVELMGGELVADSVEGIGSKFGFDLTFDTINLDDAENIKEAEVFDASSIRFKGEILVCEDNAMNMMVVSEHLSRLGLKVVGACDGKQGVEIVEGRIQRNEKPFDLIFMDMHMPVMDGIDAAKRLEEIGNKSPVVALTANIMSQEKDIYKKYGMRECVSKPFTAQELVNCLLKYFTPVEWIEDKACDVGVSRNIAASADEKLRKKLIANFVKDNQSAYKNIETAIENGDIKLAHRLVHTLKSTAGLIDRATLMKAAALVEAELSSGETDFSDGKLEVLKQELQTTLDELALLVGENTLLPSGVNEFDIKNALEIIGKLRPLIKDCKVESVDLLDGLRGFEQTDVLIRQIEDYDFDLAIETLESIRLDLEANYEY